MTINSTSTPSGPAGTIGKESIIKLIDNMTDDSEELEQVLKAVNYTLSDKGSVRSQTALYRRMKEAENLMNKTVSLLTEERSSDRVLRELVDNGRYDSYDHEGTRILLEMPIRGKY